MSMHGGATLNTEVAAETDYWQWQERLVRTFLNPAAKPGPFSLFVDEEEATRLWPKEPHASESLSAAVSARVDWQSGDPFRKLAYEAARWERGRQQAPPPTLPLLAVTVLAASRMHHDADASSLAYFLRLAQALRPDASGPHLQELRQKLSTGFDPVASMWRALDRWVGERSESLGASTIRGDHHFKRIGYPLSQALVRSDDRLRLTAFFHAVQVRARGVPEPVVLLEYLRIWASRPRGLSQSLMRALSDARCDSLLADYLSRLASSWDGTVLTVEGKRRLDVRVAVDLHDMRARWAIPLVAGIDREVLTSESGARVEITRPQVGSLYELHGDLPAVADGLHRGFRLTSRSCAAAADRSQILAFGEDADAGGWLSMPSVRPFEDHLLAVAPALRREIEGALDEAAEPGWKALPQRPSSAILPGWIIYRSVRFTDAGALHGALRRVGGALAHALRPDASLRPRLANGLPIARHLAAGHYLAGGEPDLVIPAGTEIRHVPASLDGVAQVPPFLAKGFPIELRRRGPLSLGEHELLVDGDRLRFSLLAGTGEPPPCPPRPLTWKSKSGYKQLGPADGEAGAMYGALVPGECPEPMLIRRGSTAWLISRDGCASPRTAPDLVPPVPGRALPQPYYFEITPAQDHVWMVETRAGRPRPPLLLRWQEPYFAHLDEESKSLWGAAAPAPHSEDKLWELYLRAWRRWSAC
jgi:hypothetical protein